MIKWKLIFELSFFGFLMALATVFSLDALLEPIAWLIVFLFCAYMIARYTPGRYFLHGFLLSMVNCIWVTSAHVLLYNFYMGNHPEMVSFVLNVLPNHPRLLTALTGPVFGALSGVVLGLFSLGAAKILQKRAK
jgi:hypothetical protein